MNKGIWKNDYIFSSFINEEYRITLNEGNNTLLRVLHDNYREIYILKEDENPNYSHKDRYIAFLLSSIMEKKKPEGFLISSSGNAGISLAKYSKLIEKPSIIFLKPDTPNEIVESIIENNGYPILTNKPINYSNASQKLLGFYNMRATLNPEASEGYRTIPAEIMHKGIIIDSVFVYCTSFLTLQGIIEGYEVLKRLFHIKIPRLFAVLSGDFHPFKKLLKKESINENINILEFEDGIISYFIGKTDNEIYNDGLKTGGYCPYERFLSIYKKIKAHNGSIVYVKDLQDSEIDDFMIYNRIKTSFQSETSLRASYLFQNNKLITNPLIIQSGRPLRLVKYGKYNQQYEANTLKDLKNHLKEAHGRYKKIY